MYEHAAFNHGREWCLNTAFKNNVSLNFGMFFKPSKDLYMSRKLIRTLNRGSDVNDTGCNIVGEELTNALNRKYVLPVPCGNYQYV